mmetsp:Transcript_50610/g.107809  ORF Transcript_50610/g.107809 Transcript_50610/m.107809 type:complete len:236 (-) Transcript_50610:234-941(-)
MEAIRRRRIFDPRPKRRRIRTMRVVLRRVRAARPRPDPRHGQGRPRGPPRRRRRRLLHLRFVQEGSRLPLQILRVGIRPPPKVAFADRIDGMRRAGQVEGVVGRRRQDGRRVQERHGMLPREERVLSGVRIGQARVRRRVREVFGEGMRGAAGRRTGRAAGRHVRGFRSHRGGKEGMQRAEGVPGPAGSDGRVRRVRRPSAPELRLRREEKVGRGEGEAAAIVLRGVQSRRGGQS